MSSFSTTEAYIPEEEDDDEFHRLKKRVESAEFELAATQNDFKQYKIKTSELILKLSKRLEVLESPQTGIDFSSKSFDHNARILGNYRKQFNSHPSFWFGNKKGEVGSCIPLKDPVEVVKQLGVKVNLQNEQLIKVEKALEVQKKNADSELGKVEKALETQKKIANSDFEKVKQLDGKVKEQNEQLIKVEKALEAQKKNADSDFKKFAKAGSTTSSVRVVNDTSKSVDITSQHVLGYLGGDFGAPRVVTILPGESTVVTGNSCSWGIGSGVALDFNGKKQWSSFSDKANVKVGDHLKA